MGNRSGRRKAGGLYSVEADAHEGQDVQYEVEQLDEDEILEVYPDSVKIEIE